MAISQAHTRLSTVRAISLDLDGVVYQGKHLLPGAGDAIVRLREMGLKVYFVTNSSGKTREDLAARLRRLGVAADADDVLASSYASGVIINRITGGEPRSVLAIGADGLRAELSLAGLRIVDSAPCDFLVVGLDKFINYEKISIALDALLQGATFIACNKDARYPVENGRLLPGCAAIVGAVAAAIGREPDYYAGKPDVTLLQDLADRGGFAPDEILVVGDSLESDITMANRYGSPSVHILSAEGLVQRHISYAADQQPYIVLKALHELPDLLRDYID